MFNLERGDVVRRCPAFFRFARFLRFFRLLINVNRGKCIFARLDNSFGLTVKHCLRFSPNFAPVTKPNESDMKKTIALFSLALFCALPSAAQLQRPTTPNDTLVPVRELGGGKVMFSIYAPNAKTVGFGGDATPWGKPLEFKKDASGVWHAVIDVNRAGVYRYNFTIDGVSVQDPKSDRVTENSALANIGDGKQFYDQRQDVKHGAVAQRWYYSRTLGQMRRMHVWTPAGYEKSAENLPVLYLIHGGGDNDASWPGVGCAGNILDNLLAEGKMRPMIVVMPNGSINTTTLEGEVPLFEKDLVTDIIPYTEANYRVVADAAHRAIAGLSMGGMETLETLLNDHEKFDYFWVLSSGWLYNKDTFANYQKLLNNLAPKLGHVKQLAFLMGGEEDIAYKNCKKALKLFDKAGIAYTYDEAPGGHTWYTWRNNLYELAQKIFK